MPRSKPSPISTPFIAWIDISANAMRASMRWSQDDVRAEARRHAVRAHLEHAAEALVGLAGAVDLGHHRRARVVVEAPHGRSVDALEVLRPARARRREPRRRRCAPRGCGRSRRASRRKTLASAPAATRAAVSRALARSSTLRTSVWSNLSTPARSAWPGRGRCTSSISASTGHGLMRSAQFAWSRFSIRSATGLPSVRPWRMPAQTVARSDSIFIRPPRPWPSWRRARSASMSSGATSRPAGRPSTTATRPGPWDSPAVVKRSVAIRIRLLRVPARPARARSRAGRSGA